MIPDARPAQPLQPVFDVQQAVPEYGLQRNEVLVYHPHFGILVLTVRASGSATSRQLDCGDPEALMSSIGPSLRFRGFLHRIGQATQQARRSHLTVVRGGAT